MNRSFASSRLDRTGNSVEKGLRSVDGQAKGSRGLPIAVALGSDRRGKMHLKAGDQVCSKKVKHKDHNKRGQCQD